MKIAITAAGPSLDAEMDPRFGRSPWLLIVDTQDMSAEALENPNVSRSGGAGIQTARLMTEQGVRAVLTGNCGPNAHKTLSAAGIQVIVDCQGKIASLIPRFLSGELRPVEAPNVPNHSGKGSPRP